MPYTYSYMIYIATLSWLIFGHVPDLWVVLGAVVIVVSGLVIWRREQRI
jgi:drug/metabolite transporter (DMT)-like permease